MYDDCGYSAHISDLGFGGVADDGIEYNELHIKKSPIAPFYNWFFVGYLNIIYGAISLLILFQLRLRHRTRIVFLLVH